MTEENIPKDLEPNNPPEPDPGEETTAVATTSPVPPPAKSIAPGALFGSKPATFDEAWKFAQMIAFSGDMCPKQFVNKPKAVMFAMQMGLEIGLSPLASIQNIAVINGMASLWGDALVAVCQGHRDFLKMEEWLVEEGEEMTAFCRVHRRGYQPHVAQFSKSDAMTAGLWNKNVWKGYPKRMLQNRARAFALRDRFADALRGIGSAEEQRDVIVVSGEYTPEIGGDAIEHQPAVQDSSAEITEALGRQQSPSDGGENPEAQGDGDNAVSPAATGSTPAPSDPTPTAAKGSGGRPSNFDAFKKILEEANDVGAAWDDNRQVWQSKLSVEKFQELSEVADGLQIDRGAQ